MTIFKVVEKCLGQDCMSKNQIRSLITHLRKAGTAFVYCLNTCHKIRKLKNFYFSLPRHSSEKELFPLKFRKMEIFLVQKPFQWSLNFVTTVAKGRLTKSSEKEMLQQERYWPAPHTGKPYQQGLGA